MKNSQIIVSDPILFIKMGSLSNVNFIISEVGIISLLILLVLKNKNEIIDCNESFEKSIPIFLTIILMPLTDLITLGLTFGFVSYTLLMLFAKRKNEIHKYMYFISLISIL